MAMRRPARRASNCVSAPLPGPISTATVSVTSPSASTIFCAALESVRNFVPAGLSWWSLQWPFLLSPFRIFSFRSFRAWFLYGGPMNVVFAASECVPFAKTGGLADVVGALPQALVELGHTVSVYLPKYKQTKLSDAKVLLRSVTIPFDDEYRFCSVLDGGKRSGVQFYFVDYPPFFDRDALYGTPAGDYPDNAERFALYCRAVLEASKVLGVPDIFHCHDWQSALIPVLLRTSYQEDPVFRGTRTVFTIHNIGYQGLFPPDTLPLLK